MLLLRLCDYECDYNTKSHKTTATALGQPTTEPPNHRQLGE